MLAIDTKTNSLAGSAPISNNNTGIAVSPAQHRIYISDRIFGRLTILDSDTLQVLAVKSYLGTTGFLPFTTKVVVSDVDRSLYVSYVDAAGNFTLAVMDRNGDLQSTLTYAGFSNGLDISNNHRYLVTGDGRVISSQTLGVVADLPTGLGEFQVNFAQNGQQVYITNYNSTFVTVIE